MADKNSFTNGVMHNEKNNEDPKSQTAEMQAEINRLKKQNDLFDSILDASSNGFIISNRTGKIVFANRFACELFGYRSDEMLALTIEDLVPLRLRDGHLTERKDFHACPKTRQMGKGRDLRALRKDGSEFSVEIGLTMLPNQEEFSILSTIVDITERKQFESDLQGYTEELERSNAELENFASVASHDLREPLRKIRMIGKMLARESEEDLSRKAKEYLGRMINASNRMHHLVSDILTYSRITTDTQPFVETSLSVPIAEALSNLELAIEESGGKVTVADLPVAEIDPSLIRQLFQNLIANALKFTTDGTAPTVEITGRIIDEQFCEIIVKDSGIGFDEKYANRIFDIFEKVHSRNEYHGTGVGLAICKKIVGWHNGSITASSEINKGSTFSVVLPRKQEDDLTETK